VAIGILDLLSDGGGSEAIDLPPVVTEVRIGPSLTPDRIVIEFKITNEDAGRLSARIEWLEFERGTGGDLHPGGPPVEATPAPGSQLLTDLGPGQTIHFIWDAKRDLQDASGAVQVVITPFEDDAGGEPFRTELFSAGNTPVSVQNFVLASQANQIVATFELVDAESNAITLTGVEISVDGGDPAALPAAVFEKQRKDFPSAPAPSGTRGGLIVLVTELDQPGVGEALRAVGRPGFVGDLVFRLTFQDFPTERPFEAEASLRYDHNDPPTLEVLPVLPDDLSAGVLPIRYRLSDPDGNPANLKVEVDLGDGKRFRPANEFPRAPSEGRTGIETRDPDRVHTFLWDALTQPSAVQDITLRLTASDREPGEAHELTVAGFSAKGLLRVSDLPAGFEPSAATSGDYDGDQIADLAVANEVSGTVTYYPGGAGGPNLAAEIPVGRRPRAILTGDFDGDGSLDIVTADWGAGTITYLRGGEDGLSIDRRATMAVEGGPSALATADFDGDGLPDLAVANYFAGSISYFTAGDGGLSGTRERALPVGRGPTALASGDFDSDGFSDLAVADELSDDVTVLLGGDEGLVDSSGRKTTLPVGTSPRALASGDFNVDLLDDLAVANWGSGTISYLEGSPLGLKLVRTVPVGSGPIALVRVSFTAVGNRPDLAVASEFAGEVTAFVGGIGGITGNRLRTVKVGASPHALAAGDYDGDSITDLVAVNRGSGSISWVRFFLPAGSKEVPVGAGPSAVVAGDFNGDGASDLAVANAGSSTVTYLAGGAGGPALAGKRVPVGPEPRSLVSGDFNGDGALDLAVGCASLTLDTAGTPIFSASIRRVLGGPGGPGAVTDLAVSGDPRVLLGEDFDRDGFTDLVVAGPSIGSGLLPGGAAGFGNLVSLPSGFSRTAAVGDLNGDGFLDLITAEGNAGKARFLAGTATGLGRTAARIEVGAVPRALAIGDFDGDRFVDAVLANGGSANVSFLRGGPDGPVNAGEVTAGVGPIAIDEADFDGDGFLDAAVANAGSGSVSYLRGGSAGLRGGGEIPAGLQPRALLHGDFDADGFPDLLVASGASDAVNLIAGGVQGLSSARRKAIEVGLSPIAISSGDLDGDGFLDAIVANHGSNNLTYLRGGREGLKRLGEFAAGLGPRVLEGGDYDADGFTDIVAANGNSDDLTYLRQRYLTPHASAFFDPADPERPPSISDPRTPPTCRLELLPDAFASPTQVCMVPSPIFELPQGHFAKLGKFLAAASDSMSLLSENTFLKAPVRLTLRLRDPDVDPARLVVLRREAGRGIGEPLDLAPGDLAIVDFGGGKGVSFAITRFGSYLVAAALDR
jgi:hypothetical protein